MTFNVRGAYHRDGTNTWKRRAKLNARVIRRCAPDLIGFQEHQAGNRRTYDSELASYENLLGPEYENRKPHAYNAIYWNPGRLQLLDSGGFWLSESPERFSRSWNSNQVRSANWARFRLLPANRELLHLNTHLDHKSGEARRRGAGLIVHRINDLAGEETPVFVTGDFNADPGSPVHGRFTEAGFRDAHLLAGNPPTRTFHKFQGEGFVSRRPEREGRIDWILVRDPDFEVSGAGISCRVVCEAEPPVYPSDHYPVVAEVPLREAGADGDLT